MKAKFIILMFAVFILGNTLNAEPRRVIIEYCTGTWCGWCPCGHQVIDSLIMPAYPNTISIAYHSANGDPFENFENSYIMAQLNFQAFPTAVIDRTNSPSNPNVNYQIWYQKVQQRYTSSPQSRVNLSFLSKSYNPVTRELVASINAQALEDMRGTYRVQFLITENNIVYPQFFGSGCGTYGYHNDYVHNHVARSLVSTSLGEILNSSPWNQNQVITKSFSKIIPNNWVPENLELIAFVFKDSSEVYFGAIEQAIKTPVTGVTSIQNGNNVPPEFSLSQNYPNPFNPVTNIKFSIPEDEFVTLNFYNSIGQLVYKAAEGDFKAGIYNSEINASNLAGGVYFYTLTAGSFTATKKLVLIK